MSRENIDWSEPTKVETEHACDLEFSLHVEGDNIQISVTGFCEGIDVNSSDLDSISYLTQTEYIVMDTTRKVFTSGVDTSANESEKLVTMLSRSTTIGQEDYFAWVTANALFPVSCL